MLVSIQSQKIRTSLGIPILVRRRIIHTSLVQKVEAEDHCYFQCKRNGIERTSSVVETVADSVTLCTCLPLLRIAISTKGTLHKAASLCSAEPRERLHWKKFD